MAFPPLCGPKEQVGVGGKQLKGALLLHVGLDQPKPQHRKFLSCLGHCAELLHKRTLRHVRPKYYAEGG
jgi:hypothetical protein